MRRTFAFVAVAAFAGMVAVPLAVAKPKTVAFTSVVTTYQQSQSRYTSVGDLYQRGKKVGQGHYVCALSGDTGKCTAHAKLPKGTIVFKYVYDFSSPAGPVTVTGGTKAYAGAHGTGTYTPLNALDSRTAIKLHIQ
jgi:hypothetical protein